MGSAHWRSSITNATGWRRATPFQEPTDRPERLLRRRLASRQSQDLCELPRDPVGMLVVGNQRRDLRQRLLGSSAPGEPRRLPDGFDDRPEGDPVAIGQASPPERDHPFGQRVEEGGEQARLPDAADPEDREELARVVRDRAVERVAK